MSGYRDTGSWSALLQLTLRNDPHRRKTDAIDHVENDFDAAVERLCKSDGVLASFIGNACAERTMGRPGAGAIMWPAMNRVDGRAD